MSLSLGRPPSSQHTQPQSHHLHTSLQQTQHFAPHQHMYQQPPLADSPVPAHTPTPTPRTPTPSAAHLHATGQIRQGLQAQPLALPHALPQTLGKAAGAEERVALLKTQLEAYDRIQRMQDRALSGLDASALRDPAQAEACLVELWRKTVWQLLVQRNWAEAEHARSVESLKLKVRMIDRTIQSQQETSHAMHTLSTAFQHLQIQHEQALAHNKARLPLPRHTQELQQTCEQLQRECVEAQVRGDRAEQQALKAVNASHRLAQVVGAMEQFGEAVSQRVRLLEQRIGFAADRVAMAKAMQDSERRESVGKARQLDVLAAETAQLRTDRRLLLERLVRAESAAPVVDSSTQTDPADTASGAAKPQVPHADPTPAAATAPGAAASRPLQRALATTPPATKTLSGDVPPLGVLDKLQQLEQLSASLFEA
ncbi:hypothetical protein HK105_207685 [Polyrhizophydium stewartii]|uniref:Alpha-helical coiled-coil rod protein n=1 Tax=Polyrhizophydium stewartii TaxID=2732419 RepID=A0ABR4N002_9FUNG